MKSLTKKIRIWVQKQSLKRDASKALSCASKTYWDQLSLPEELRDNTLIDESLSVIECASSVLAEGARQEDRTWLFSSGLPLSRVMTVAIACILVIALSAGAAYAMGFNVFNMFFSTGNGYSAMHTEPTFDYNSDEQPFPSIKPMDDFKEYPNIKAACQELQISPMLIDEASNPGLSVKEVYGVAAEASINLDVLYAFNDSEINYTVTRYADKHTALTVTAEGYDRAPETKETGGITFYISEKEHEISVMWSQDCYVYLIMTGMARAELMTLLESLG